ncbi:MAG: hypothetical protein LBQ29_15630 [Acinetobacter sp.]|jgi:hypothetical protein|uniref:hypothetical protein n=1 Tax=Acinetobacter sp. TaxID=472 RepID=UPI002825E278|nr:hypothetical protein [Acinetobacter sp.]MDR2062819.1 hypothetical protein [Acinetobacter sp.]
MNTIKILSEAIGIQSQGTIDKTETQTNAGLTNAVIVGQFMRGRFEQPMTIHQGNIRGQLGHDPLNPYYNAVQDCLDTGVPSVQVLRVGEKSIPISCTGALNITDWIDIDGDFGLEIDGTKITNSASPLEVIDLLRTNNFNVMIDEVPLVATPFAALNVDNDTDYRVSMNGAPLLNPATGVSSFKNLGKYPNFVVDGSTSFDLYMAVVTASGSKATAIGYQDSQVPPDHPLYTDKSILVLVTEETTGFNFEFEALTGSTNITQNAEYEQKLILNSDFPDEQLNGTIRKSGNIVSFSVVGPEPKTKLSINSPPYGITDHWLSIECGAKNTLNNTATFTATDNLGNTFTKVRTDIPANTVSIIFQIPRTVLVSQTPLTGNDFTFALTATDLGGVSQTVTAVYHIQEQPQ